MPYTSYTYISDEDALAIKAYLFSLPAAHATAPANTLFFPFNQRWAMMVWSALFNPDNFFKNSQDVFEDIASRNMLCMPRGMLVTDLAPVEIPSSSSPPASSPPAA